MSEHYQGVLQTRPRQQSDVGSAPTTRRARPTIEPFSIPRQPAVKVSGKQYPDHRSARRQPEPQATHEIPSSKTDSGLAILGHRLKHDSLPRLGKGWMTGLNLCLPDEFRIQGGGHAPHDYVRAAAEYAYAVAPSDTRQTALPWTDSMRTSCRILLGLVPAQYFNDANPDIVEAIVSGTTRYFRHIEMRISPSSHTPEGVQSSETRNGRHSVYQSRQNLLRPSPVSEPTIRLAAESTHGKLVDSSRSQHGVILIGSSPERTEEMGTRLRSSGLDVETHTDGRNKLHWSLGNEAESVSSRRLLRHRDRSSVSHREASFEFREVTPKFVKQEPSSDRDSTADSQKTPQWQQEVGLRKQEGSMVSDGLRPEYHSKSTEYSGADNNKPRKHKTNSCGTMTLPNSNAEGQSPKPSVGLTERDQYLRKQPLQNTGVLQDLQYALKQAETKDEAPTRLKESQTNKVRGREEVIVDLFSDDNVRTTQSAKKRKLNTYSVQPLTVVQQQEPAPEVPYEEPRIAALARAPVPPSLLPMYVSGRVTNPLHPGYEDGSTSSLSSDDDAGAASLPKPSCSQTSARKTTNSTPRQVPTPSTTASSHVLALLSNPPEARADIDPASQLKTSKVFTVDVQEKLARRRANRIKFLEQVLEEAGIDDDQLDQMEQRLKMKDSLKNAFDAVVKRRTWMRNK